MGTVPAAPRKWQAHGPRKEGGRNYDPSLLVEADYSLSPGEKAIAWPVAPVSLKIIYLRALQKYIGKRKIKVV